MTVGTPLFMENDTTTQHAQLLRMERHFNYKGRSGMLTTSAPSATQSSNGQLTYPPGYTDQASGPATYEPATSATCKVCGLPLDKALIALGDVTHPGCDPVPWPAGTIGEGASE